MKNKTYKQLAVLISIMLAFGLLLGGCSKPEPKEPEEEAPETEETEPLEEGEEGQEGETSEEPAESEEAESEEAVESQEEQTPAEEVQEPEEPAFDVETANKRKAKYAEVLRNLQNDLILPGGIEVYYDGSLYGSLEENTFSVFDIDGDGIEELIIKYSTAPMMAMFERVYGYDEENDAIIEKLSSNPFTEFYENGIAKIMISHNQGEAGKFWPYTLCKYNKKTKVYDQIAFINAWDGEYFPENYDGEPFPDEEDTDGDKMLYYISPEGYGISENSKSININELEKWLTEKTGNGEELFFDEFRFTDYNIERYEKGEAYTLSYDEGYQKFTIGNLEYYLPEELVDKVVMEETERGVNIIQKEARDFGTTYLGYDGLGWLGSVVRYSDASYYDLPGYYILSYSMDDSYIMRLPTDVRSVGPEYLQEAAEKGYKGTEEDLNAMRDEYTALYKMIRSVQGTVD